MKEILFSWEHTDRNGILISTDGVNYRYFGYRKPLSKPRGAIELRALGPAILASEVIALQAKQVPADRSKSQPEHLRYSGVGRVEIAGDGSMKVQLLTNEEIKKGMKFNLSDGVKVVETTAPPTEEKKAEAADPLEEVILVVCSEEKEHVPQESYFYEDPLITKPIIAAINNKDAVLLEGDTGCGKTTVVKHLAAKSKNGFRRVNLNGETSVEDLVGKYKLNKDKEMVWIDGVLTECLRKGLWFLCDEVNAALPEVKFVLHSVLDDDRYLVLTQKDGEIVRAHPDFRFFGTMNPSYAGTHTLNKAFEDRFSIKIKCGYPPKKEEIKIVSVRSGYEDKSNLGMMVDVANKCRKLYEKETISSPFSTRRLIDWAKLVKNFGVLDGFRLAVLNKIPLEEHALVLDVCDAVFPGAEFRKKLEVK